MRKLVGVLNGVEALHDAPAADEVRQQLARIVDSAAFRGSLRLSQFLTFVVETTLAGKADTIKAYTIAVEALGRGGDFDPQSDPIVRVEAGRLRTALTRYYSSEGCDDPLIIEVPRGSYVPVFAPRNAPPAIRETPAAEAALNAILHTDHPADLLNVALRNLVGLRKIMPILLHAMQHSDPLDRPVDARHETSDERHRFDAAELLGPPRDPGDRNATAIRLITLLDELSARLLACADLKSAVETILAAAIRLHKSDFGNVQLFDEGRNELIIYAPCGFDEKFLDAFARLSADDGCACGRVLRDRVSVIVEDVLHDPDFEPYRAIAAAVGFRAVQWTPLVTSGGRLVGVVSTHFAHPHVPSRLEMSMTRLYARLAADIVARLWPVERTALTAEPGRQACRPAPPLLPTAPSSQPHDFSPADGRQEQGQQQAQGAAAARARRPRAGGDRGDAPDAGHHPRGLRALRV